MWTPKQTLGNNTVGAISGTPSKVQEIELPAIGETMGIVVMPYGGFQVAFDGSIIPNGAQVIEVEVKAIKKAKIILE